MGTVTAYNMANIQSALGGSNPISLSEYYRGGSYVPTTRTVSTTVRDPSSGDYYNRGAYGNSINTGFINATIPGYGTYTLIGWFGTILNNNAWITGTYSSWSQGGYTYYRGTYRTTYYTNNGYGTETWLLYGIYRTYPSTTTVSINTGVPSSGSISIGQLYGAENP